MKKILVALIFLCAGYWAAVNQAKLKAWWQEAEKSAMDRYAKRELGNESSSSGETGNPSSPPPSKSDLPEFTPTPAPTPSPSTPPVAAPTPISPPPVDDGVYYTRERITEVTDAGVAAIPERTKVRVVGERDGKLIVEAGGKRVLAARIKLTNDPTEIASLVQEASIAAAQAEANKPKPPAPPDAKAVKAENATKRRVLQTKVDVVNQRIYDLQAYVSNLQNEAWAAKARGRPSTYNDRTIAATMAQIRELEAQRTKLKLEEAAIPY